MDKDSTEEGTQKGEAELIQNEREGDKPDTQAVEAHQEENGTLPDDAKSDDRPEEARTVPEEVNVESDKQGRCPQVV